MACCLTAPSHYLNQCWLIISKVLWLSCEGNFTRDTSIINHYDPFENKKSQISFKFPRGQWVEMWSMLGVNNCSAVCQIVCNGTQLCIIFNSSLNLQAMNKNNDTGGKVVRFWERKIKKIRHMIIELNQPWRTWIKRLYESAFTSHRCRLAGLLVHTLIYMM